MDIVVAAAVALTTEGPEGPFFVFLMFPLLAAAFRWGLAETVTTAIVAVLVITGETGVLGSASPGAGAPGRFQPEPPDHAVDVPA